MIDEAPPHRMIWVGPLAEAFQSSALYLDIEGAFRAAKTTVTLWKIHQACIAHPGMHWLIARWSEGDTQSKLKPVWREICAQAGTAITWHGLEQYDELDNRSRVYILGLKSAQQTSRFAKFRGLTLAGVYVDQAEELPHDVFEDLKGRLSQPGHPHQFIVTPNPPPEDHWIAEEWPDDRPVRDHALIRVSIYDNAHNLDADTIRALEEAYPAGHAKRGPALLGLRGLNVGGKAVYGPPQQGTLPIFQRAIHERPLAMNPDLPLCEAIDFGQHHPCVVWAQFTPYGGLHILGGVMGQSLYLEDFIPIMQQYRSAWFPHALAIRTCCDPAGSHDNSQGIRQNGVALLRDKGYAPIWEPNSNAPDVRLAMVERIAGYMRRRTALGEAFGVDRDRWALVTAAKVSLPKRFLADGLEAGYVWDTHMRSVSHKPVRVPKKDGWYEHGMNCCEYLELNFGGVQPTVEQTARRAAQTRQRVVRQAQRDYDPYDRRETHRLTRGGY